MIHFYLHIPLYYFIVAIICAFFNAEGKCVSECMCEGMCACQGMKVNECLCVRESDGERERGGSCCESVCVYVKVHRQCDMVCECVLVRMLTSICVC